MDMTKEKTKSGLTFCTSGALVLTTNADAQVPPNSFKLHCRSRRLQIFRKVHVSTKMKSVHCLG